MDMGDVIGGRRVKKVSVDLNGIKYARRHRKSELDFLKPGPVKVIGAFDWQFKSTSKYMLYRGINSFGDKQFEPRAYVYLERWERPRKAKGLQNGKTIPGAGAAALIGDKLWHRWILTVRMTHISSKHQSGGQRFVKHYGRPFTCVELSHDLSRFFSRHYNSNQFAGGVTDAVGVVDSMLS